MDETGNNGGDWILESHNINIKNVYFNSSIDNWEFNLDNSDLVYTVPYDQKFIKTDTGKS